LGSLSSDGRAVVSGGRSSQRSAPVAASPPKTAASDPAAATRPPRTIESGRSVVDSAAIAVVVPAVAMDSVVSAPASELVLNVMPANRALVVVADRPAESTSSSTSSARPWRIWSAPAVSTAWSPSRSLEARAVSTAET